MRFKLVDLGFAVVSATEQWATPVSGSKSQIPIGVSIGATVITQLDARFGRLNGRAVVRT